MIDCSFDYETDGLYVHQGHRPFAYCIGYDTGKVEVYRLNCEANRRILYDFWADTNIRKIMHNAKFELSMTKAMGITIPENTKFDCTMLMSQLLRNLAPSHALDFLCWELCGYDRSIDLKVKQLAGTYGTYDKIPEHLMNVYQIADGERTQLLYQTFKNDIESDEKLYKDYQNELELVKTTIRLEEQGINIDVSRCQKLIHWMEDELDGVQDSLYNLVGEYINLNSGEQVARLLYRRLKLPVIERTATGKPSTDKHTLAKLREDYPHEIHDLILKQRAYQKGIAMITSYIDKSDKNNVIHPTINTNKAKTGRQSSTNPNMQNVSKKAALLNPFPVPSRECFVPPTGHVYYLVDYSGIEMRLIINEAGELEMIEVVNNNGDVHSMASEILFGDIFTNETDKDRKKVLRSAGKNANFATPYGAGPKKVAATLGIDQLGISEEQFLLNFKEYQNRWPKIAFFTQNIIRVVKEHGYVETVFGRKLFIPRDKVYSGANYLIQGTAAGVLKRAQVRVDKYLKENWNDEIRLVMPIHDEMIIAYPKKLLKYKDRILPEISRIMINMPEIQIKLDVEWRITTKTWNDAKDITVKY